MYQNETFRNIKDQNKNFKNIKNKIKLLKLNLLK